MKILIVADTHGTLLPSTIDNITQDNALDYVFFLGDVYQNDISLIKSTFTNVPMLGIVGNHDGLTILSDNGILDIHLKTVNVGSYTVGGYGGCIKYKNSNHFLLHTNEESEEELLTLPYCDILICHDKPSFPENNPDTCKMSIFQFIKKHLCIKCSESQNNAMPDSHSGLTGLGIYIDKNEPRMVLHGHIHQEVSYTHKNTTIRSFYGLSLIDIPTSLQN